MQILLLKHTETFSLDKTHTKKNTNSMLFYIWELGVIMELQNICDGSENIYN